MDCTKPDSLHHVFLQVLRFHFNRMHMLLEKLGVYPGQPPLLLALEHKDGQSQKELAERLNIKPSTITVMLNRMTKAKLIERRQDPEDQRISRVYLTERGREVCGKVKETMKVLEEECFDNFSAEEKVLLRRLLTQMRNNLIKACDKSLDI